VSPAAEGRSDTARQFGLAEGARARRPADVTQTLPDAATFTGMGAKAARVSEPATQSDHRGILAQRGRD